MTRKRFLLPMLFVVLLLGLAASFAWTSAGRAGQLTTSDPTTTASTTDGGTATTVPDTTTATVPDTTTATVPDTTAAVTTAPDTTTATEPATTTAADPTPATTTTTGDTTAGSNTGSTGQATAQSSGNVGPATTSPSSPPPTAPCDTTQLTCGNNAATQIAVVSQNCVAASSDPLISVAVTTVAGAPVNNFTIANVTTCLNVANITQVVQQFCLGCAIVVVPPPPPPPPFVPAPAAAATHTAPPPPPPPARAGYCLPEPMLRSDGTWGRFVDLEAGQPLHDPKFAKAVAATYTAGVGFSCADGSRATGPAVPTFTLTVPASFVGQFVDLCIQPSDPAQKPVCHAVKIDDGATISIPVASNVAATVKSAKATNATKAKSKKQIAAALAAFGRTNATAFVGRSNTTSARGPARKPVAHTRKTRRNH